MDSFFKAFLPFLLISSLASANEVSLQGVRFASEINAESYGKVGFVDIQNTRKLNMPYMKDVSIVSIEFLNRIQPKSVDKNETGNQVLSKMIDRSLSYWWATTPLRKTSLGRAAETIEEKAQIKAELQDSNNVKHRFDFKVMLSQALAKIEYSGWIKAAISYDAKSSIAEAQIIQNIDHSKDIVLSHLMGSDENLSRLSLRVDW